MAEDFVFDLYKDMEPDNSDYPVYNNLTSTVEELAKDGVTCLLILDFDGVINIIKDQRFKYYPPNNTPENPTQDSIILGELEESINYNYYQVDNIKDVMNVHYAPPPAWSDTKIPRYFSIRWSSEMIEDLNKICASPHVQVISLTTWRQWMREPCELMGFKPAREVLTLQWGSESPTSKLYYKQYYKGHALKEWLSQGTVGEQLGMAWIDDAILKPEHLAYRHRLPEPFFTQENALLIAPHEFRGISRHEMRSIKDFVAGKQ